MLILQRYLFKELSLQFAGIISVLLLVILSNRFGFYLSKTAIGQLPSSMICQILLLYIPEFFSLLCPIASFLSILLCYERFYAEQELPVIFSSGMSLRQFSLPTLIWSLSLAALTLALNVGLAPTLANIREELMAKGQQLGMLQQITPGTFHKLGNTTIFAEKIVEQELQHVFIAPNLLQNQGEDIILAKSAKLLSNEQGQYYLELYQGQRYQQQRQPEPSYRITNFARYRRLLALPVLVPDLIRTRSSSSLYRASEGAAQAEWQWRWSLPLSIVTLASIAVALYARPPLRKRFWQLLPAILIYILYYNLLLIQKQQISHLPEIHWPAMLPVHLLMLALAYGIWYWQTHKQP
jgi:lipopolysaccharide export system permease protein